MSTAYERVHEALRKHENTPESYAHEIKLSLSKCVIDRLMANQWTQKQLADRIGVTEPFISRVLSGDANFTADTAGKFLFACGVRARIVPVGETNRLTQLETMVTWTTQYVEKTDIQARIFASTSVAGGGTRGFKNVAC